MKSRLFRISFFLLGCLILLSGSMAAAPSGAATVAEISYYRDQDLTKPLVDSAMVEDVIYTKVVFSRDVPIVIADDEGARPSISSDVGLKQFQYRMKPWSISDEQFRSGDAKPLS